MTTLFAITGCQNRQKVDLIIYNATVYTVDNDFSKAEAFAVKNGRFVAVGSSEEIMKLYRADDTRDLHGAPVYPGSPDDAGRKDFDRL